MSFRTSALPSALVALATLTPCAALVAQDPQAAQPVDSFGEEISVEVVGLPVWVTDHDGNLVTDLDRDDFVILQDGKPVDLVNFAVVDESDAGRPPVQTPPSEIERGDFEPLDVPTIGSEDAVHLAVLVDNWNLKPEDRARVFRGLRDYLAERVQPGDRIALMVHDRSVRLVEPFTDDREELGQALDRIEQIAPSATTLDSAREDALDGVEQAYMTYFGNGGDPEVACQVSAGWGAMENAARDYAAAVQAHVRVSASAVATAAQSLTGLPGHRVLLYVGAGMPQTAGIEIFQLLGDVCPSRQSELGFFHLDYDLTWLYQEVADRANAAGVTLYALEGSSPAVDLGFNSRLSGGSVSTGSPTNRRHIAGTTRGGTVGYGPSFRPSVAAQRQRSLDDEGSLVLLAGETGGRAFLNAPEFAGDFARIAQELHTYYSLGFRPPGPGDGQLHRLEVRVPGHDGYRVRYRRAYRDKSLAQHMAERVGAVAQFGGGANPLAVRVEVGDPLPAGGSTRVPVRIWVPLPGLTLVPGGEEGELQGRLQVLMAATEAGGALGPVRQKMVPVSARPGEKGVAGDQLVEVDVQVPPGEHYVALAVRDAVGGEVSYLRRRFWVPPAGVAVVSPEN